MIPGEKRVLLIDSYQATREARTAVLRHYGIEVFPADNLALARSLIVRSVTAASCQGSYA